MSAIIPPRSLDEHGRCCGRKPLFYKSTGGLKVVTDPHWFCFRCNAEFCVDGHQRPNWAYKQTDNGFVATYPESDATKLALASNPSKQEAVQ